MNPATRSSSSTKRIRTYPILRDILGDIFTRQGTNAQCGDFTNPLQGLHQTLVILKWKVLFWRRFP
jgi:hypothetical protein